MLTNSAPFAPVALLCRNKLLDAAHCEPLTLRDLMRPPPQRTTRVLSALINLQKFKADRLEWYVELENRKMDLLQQKESLLAAHEDVRDRIAALRSLRDSEQPEIDALTAKNATLAAELDRLRLIESTTRASASKTRDDIASLKVHIEEVHAATQATRADTEMKRSQIVSSPLRVKAEVGVLEAAVATEQAVVSQLDADKQMISRQMEIVAKADKDVNKAMTLMAEAEAEAVKLKRIIKDSKAKQETKQAIQGEIAALEEELGHTYEKRKRAEERLHEVREQLNAKLAAQSRQLDATRREAAEYEDDIRAAVETRQSAEREKEALERQVRTGTEVADEAARPALSFSFPTFSPSPCFIFPFPLYHLQKENLISRHAAEVADMVASMKRFSSAVSGYHSSLFASLHSAAAVDLAPAHAHGHAGSAGAASEHASTGIVDAPGYASAMKPLLSIPTLNVPAPATVMRGKATVAASPAAAPAAAVAATPGL